MSRQNHRRHDEQLAKMREVQQEPKPKPSFQEHLRQVEAVSFVLSIAAILMENYFWWFVGFFVVAVLLEIVHSFTAKTAGKFRYVTGCLFIAVLVFFYFQFIRASTFFETTAQWTEGNYQAGTDVHGLIWKDGWSELMISFNNPSSIDVKDFDLAFLVDEGIAEVKQFSGAPCSVIQSGTGVIDVTGKTKTGEQVLFAPLGFTDTPYRLICDKFPAHSAVSLIVALINMDPSMKIYKAVVGAKKAPSLIRYRAHYKVRSRPYDVQKGQKPTVY